MIFDKDVCINCGHVGAVPSWYVRPPQMKGQCCNNRIILGSAEQIINERKIWYHHKRLFKLIPYTLQLMRSINQKKDCDGIKGCYGMAVNKRIMLRAKKFRLH